MNKRIKELMDKATTIEEHGWGASYENFDREKFAELIVQECCDVVEKNLYQNIGWNTSRAVRRHFGLGPEE
jgi:hypothetical protein